MGIQGMKVHHFPRGFWEHEPPPTSLTLGCKRLRPLAPKPTSATAADSFDLKTIIRPQTSPCRNGPSNFHKNPQPDQLVEAQQQPPPGGTRWNPTQEQIGILEMLYRGGMRTPNAQQIEHITAHLAKYGKIEGKNVFYWFQNHKARDRQKQKRYNNNIVVNTRVTPDLALSSTKGDDQVEEEEEKNECKRKCRTWGLEEESKVCTEWEELGEDRTLKLFPLHPEGRV